MTRTKKLAFLAMAGAAALAAWLVPAPQSTQAAIGDWPQWRGPARNGISPDTGLLRQWAQGGPALAWKSSGLGSAYSSLAIASGKIFTMGDIGDEQFTFGVNQTDGKVLWRTKVGPAWKDEFAGPRGTPTVDGDSVYVMGTEGDLLCLDAATGKERWRKNLPTDFGGRMMSIWKFSESVLVDGNKLVFTPGGKDTGMVAVDKRTGKELWRTSVPDLGPKGKDGAAYSGMVISEAAGVRQYVQLTGRGLIGVRASDGKMLWGYNRVANDIANISSPVVKGDYVFASTGYNTGAALVKLAKAGNGVKAEEVYWLEPRVFQNHHGGIVLVGDYLYAGHGHNKGFPICIEFLTGKVVWGGDIRNGGTGVAAVVFADGNLYYRYQNGTVKLIEASPAGYKEKGSFDIPGANLSWSHPVVIGGKLYLREQDNLYVYNVKQ